MNKKVEAQGLTIAELAKELSQTEANIRRFISFFEVPTVKKGRRILVETEGLQMLKEIVRLKENGLSVPKIKELRDGLTVKPKEEKQVIVKEEPKIEQTTEKSDKHNNKNQNRQEQQQPKQEDKTDDKSPSIEKSPEIDSKTRDKTAEPSRDIQEKSNTNRIQKEKTTYLVTPQKLTKNLIGQEITRQSRSVAKLNRQLITLKRSPKEYAEVKSLLNYRYEFMAGLRYIRDNWITN